MSKLGAMIIAICLMVAFAAPAAPRCFDAFDFDYGYLFGLEFTVTNDKVLSEGNRNPSDFSLDNNPIKKAYYEDLVRKLEEKCAATSECRTSWTRDKHGKALKVLFKDGYFFTVGSDAAVLEANALPLGRINFKNVKVRLQEYFFDVAKSVGLVPHQRAGQGHIHISRKAFSENALLFRNFFVDFQNRPELIYGALGNHLSNSPPLAALKPEQRTALREVLSSFNESTTINQFIEAVHKKVYTSTYNPTWDGADYYQAFNMTRMWKPLDQATVEIRSFRPQANVEIFELQTRLLERWIERLRSVNEPIPYIRKNDYEYTPEEIVDSFYQLIKDLELPWKEFKALLPADLQRVKPKNKYQSVSYNYSQFKATEMLEPAAEPAAAPASKNQIFDPERLKKLIDEFLD